jgi:hypothetical protein
LLDKRGRLMNKNKLILLHDPVYSHVSKDTVLDLEDALIKGLGFKKTSIPKSTLIQKIIKKICFQFPFLIKVFRKSESDKTYFLVCMGRSGLFDMIGHMNNNSRKVIYVFDSWESTYSKFEKILNAMKIDVAFFHSEQAAIHFKKVLTHTKSYWIPEGIHLEEYYSKPLKKRNIDVLQMGRKYDKYHNKILSFCINSGINYLYEKEKGIIIFPTKKDFLKGLASTKISICTPQSITHPERVGAVSTMTQRYLQSMSAKCLILGIMPKDMEKLFGYVPLISIDMKNPTRQITKILNNYEKYLPLIERNYVEVKNNHQWKNRIETMRSIMVEVK